MKLCRDCEHCKTVQVGHASYRSWCKALPKNIRGLHPWKNEVNPRCPLKENRKEKSE